MIKAEIKGDTYECRNCKGNRGPACVITLGHGAEELRQAITRGDFDELIFGRPNTWLVR
jgi:hypothetical protein